jgi:tRNA(fMet)-specific endonuclease VapC
MIGVVFSPGGKTENRMVVKAKVSSDGSLHLDVPLGVAAAGNEVQVTVELLPSGARRIANPAATRLQVQTFCAPFVSLPFDDRAAEEYGNLRAHLASLGTSIGPNDRLIAAIDLANGLILVTHNTAEFSSVPGLTLEDWQ